MFQKIVNYIARTGLISSGVIEPIFSHYTDNVEMINQIIDAVENFDVEFLDISGEVFVSQNCLIGDNHFKVVILCINDTTADRIKELLSVDMTMTSSPMRNFILSIKNAQNRGFKKIVLTNRLSGFSD